MEDVRDIEPSSFVPEGYKGITILVVDDDRLFQSRITSILQAFTYKVVVTAIPTEGLEMIRKDNKRFQIVLANLQMKGMRRLSFLRILAKNRISVVAIVRRRSENYFDKIKKEGAKYCMVKPNDWPDLKNVWQYASLKRSRSVVAIEAEPSSKKYKKPAAATSVEPPQSKGKEVVKEPEEKGEEVVREPEDKGKGKEVVKEAEDKGEEVVREPEDKGKGKEVVRAPEGKGKEVVRAPAGKGKHVVRQPEVQVTVIGDNVIEWTAKPFKEGKGSGNIHDHSEYYYQIKAKYPLTKKTGNPPAVESTPKSFTTIGTSSTSSGSNFQSSRNATSSGSPCNSHVQSSNHCNALLSAYRGTVTNRNSTRTTAIAPASFTAGNYTSPLQWTSTGSNNNGRSLFGVVGFDNGASPRYVHEGATNFQGLFTGSSYQGQNAMKAANYSSGLSHLNPYAANLLRAPTPATFGGLISDPSLDWDREKRTMFPLVSLADTVYPNRSSTETSSLNQPAQGGSSLTWTGLPVNLPQNNVPELGDPLAALFEQDLRQYTSANTWNIFEEQHAPPQAEISPPGVNDQNEILFDVESMIQEPITSQDSSGFDYFAGLDMEEYLAPLDHLVNDIHQVNQMDAHLSTMPGNGSLGLNNVPGEADQDVVDWMYQ